jgi:hypothetical protein
MAGIFVWDHRREDSMSTSELTPRGQQYHADLLETTQAVLRDSGNAPGTIPCTDENLLHAIAERMEVRHVDSMAVRDCLETLLPSMLGG